MEIKYNKIILRDTDEKDIEDYVRWNTIETEWQDWDAPWEKINAQTERLAAASQKLAKAYIESAQRCEENNLIRKHMEICINDENCTHVGWICRYFIDENCRYTREEKRIAVGLDIVSTNVRGHGYGYEAMTAFINYLSENGIREIYTQTWSGNTRMIRLAAKAGFVECDRKPGIRTVNAQKYDAITFVRK